MAKNKREQGLAPDRQPITALQAKRLAALTDVKAQELTGLSIAEISEKYKYRIDPGLLCLRRICGQVVKKDPATGEEYPVPFATVHVEDIDCNLLWYFPAGWPWGWFYPFFCHREEIATVVTDACGRFCVYVPCWEIDWILRWRHERICFPDIFVRPRIWDLLEELFPDPPVIRWPIPEPDPPPFLLKGGGAAIRRAEELVGSEITGRLAALEAETGFGSLTTVSRNLLSMPAFSQPLPPPLPREIQQMSQMKDTKAIAAHLSLEHKFVEQFAPERFIGPFLRCKDIFIPEWTPILDVPDITFRVTQDVDGSLRMWMATATKRLSTQKATLTFAGMLV